MSESKKVQIRTGRRGAGLNSTVAPVAPKPRPAPSKPNSGGRRGKQKPEPLPAIPDSPGSARESGLLPSRSQSSRADAQESQALANMLSDGDMPLVLVADSNSHMNPAAEGTHEPEKRRALSGGNEPDSVQTPAKQALVQRPRSTTTTPFGGRKRGIFTRPEGVQRAATTQAYAPHSSSVSPTGGDTSTWQRSHSENERLVVTRSVSGQEQAAVGTDTRVVQSATAAHFHIASGNVLNDAQKRVPRLSKRDSSMTASTVEIPESVASSLSTDRSMASNSVGQQNSRSEVFSPTSTLRRTESDVVIPSEGTRGTQVKPKVSSSVFSQSKAAGRSKRGGSGGDLRTSEFKGAAKPAASGGVFGSKQRANTGEQLQTSGHDSADLVINTSHSGPSEASSMFLSPGPDQGFGVPRNRLAATQRKGGHGAMTERSAEDYPGQNGADGKRVWLYTPPTRPTAMDLILSGAAPNNPRQGSAQQGSGEARSARMPSNQNNSPNETSQQLIGKLSGTSAMAQGASAGGKVHYRRDSATRQSSAMSGSTLFGTTGRVTSAGRVDRDHSDLADAHSTDGAQASSGGQQLLSPWAFTPTRGHKKTLVFEQPWRWNAVAPSPNKQPICAVAGHDGLVLLRMGPDQITQEAHMAMGRRWNMSMDFKDVIWRPSEYITTGSNDGTVTIWDPERRTDQLVRKFSDYSRPVNRLTPKPDNPYFVYAAYSDGYIVGWDVRASDRNSGIRLTGSLTAQDIDCTPSDASKIAAITQEGRLLVWDNRKPTTPYLNFDAHPAYRGQCIAWHPNGRFIGSGGSDQAIKVWDITTASKKFSVSPFCAIRTLAHVHKLQWRPGHDTQLSSCALSSDIRFQVWDMHNPNHSLMFHDRHKGAISGFTWYDDDVVWSSTREGDVVQCDMQNDAVFTAGLMGNIVAEFSSQHHLAVATGEFFQRKSSCIEHIMVDVSATQKRQGVVQKPGGSASGQSTFSGSANPLLAGIKNSGKMSLELLKYQTNLPQAFLDEHVLDHKLTGEPNAMAYLARTYRFDPDEFSACCEHNAKISSARFPEISRFWRFLSTMLGDSLPLKPRKRPGKSRKKETSDLQSERQL
ncbi:SEA (Seh1-associated) complex subunit, partial [Linderina pennispora]